jgi:uncharacterized protein (DUF2252 family)
MARAASRAAKQLPTAPDRAAILAARRNRKMASSAHAYMRGNTLKFYEWLDTDCGRALPEGPPVWICGDCHVGNLGPLADAKGRIKIEIRDLDQSVIGNPAHDLLRLALSLATAARGSDLPGVTTAKMLEQMMAGYVHALQTTGARRADKQLPKSIHTVMRQAVNRTWEHLAADRIEDTRPTIPLGKTFWPLTKVEHRETARLFKTDGVRRLVTALKSRDDDARVRLLDAAYWVKGCSSLGRLRIAALVGVENGGRKDDEVCLIDLKEGVQAAAPRARHVKMPRDNAERVVEGARHLAPSLGDRMLPARFLNRAVFIRELLPQDLKIEIDQLSRDEAVEAARFLSGVVGRAHARQMDGVTRRRWCGELARNRLKRFDAPSWLWTSVVDLVAIHEAAYLEYCRRYALDTAAR